MEIRVRNVNEGIAEAFWKLRVMGVEEESRNGPVLVFPEPVMTIYEKPCERVLFWPERDANPIFHLMESIWMMAGRRDVKFPELFNSRIGQYSDDGEVFNAAYGHRWREHFGVDQLSEIIKLLKKDPKTRRAVMQMWDPADLTKNTKDMACNTQVFFEIRNGKLNMTVLNRSNDIWYGCYGANAVHFSFMMEFVAIATDVEVGEYRQFSNNLHLYTELYDAKKHLENPPIDTEYDYYKRGVVNSTPMMSRCSRLDNSKWKDWLNNAELFCDNPFLYDVVYPDFFRYTAYPMAMVSKSRKEKTSSGMNWAEKIHDPDWRIATIQWIERREKAKVK